MPIPRRFDRRPPERDQTRVNERIRVPEVRLIGEDGNQVGVISRDDALAYAQQRDLDLVEVAAEARPPVVRVLDYSKYKYEQEQKAKAAKRHQKNINVREIKLRPKIAENDYSTKKGHVSRFLKAQDKVKVTIMFRGREMTHPERGERLLLRLADEIQELGTVEQRPTQDGRNMIMMLAPLKTRVDAETEAGDDGEPPSESAAPAVAMAAAPVAATPAVAAGGEAPDAVAPGVPEGPDAVAPGLPEGSDAVAPGVPEGSDAATPAVPDVAEVPAAATTRSPARRRAAPSSATPARAGKEADSPPTADEGAGDAPPAPIAASGKPARRASAPKGSAAKAPAARKGNGAAEDPAADAVETDPATAAS